MNNFTHLWSLDFTQYAYWALAVALFAMIMLLAVQLPLVRKVASLAIKQTRCPVPDLSSAREVSVVVYAHNDAWNLPTLVEQIFSQDYPGAIEVVVANDVAFDNTEDVVKELMSRYPNLRYTFAPAASRNLSRKKLVITLGIKAASNDVIVVTSGNCRIDSATWLSRMMRHVEGGKDVVIGYATLRDHDGNPGTNLTSRLVSFDMVWDSVRYLSSAIAGKPVRGNGNNLIYRKSMFLNNKGFARSLNLNYGDDDILVSEIATRHNSAVEISADSIIEAREDRPGVVYELERIHHNFTSGFLPRTPRFITAFMSLCWWLWLIATGLMVWLGLPSLIPAAAALVMVCGLWIPFMLGWKRTCVALKAPHAACFTVPLLMLWHPFYNLRLTIMGLMSRRDNYTWSK